MNQPMAGDVVKIESYKHDGMIHRVWEGSVLLQKSPTVVIGNNQIRVIESDGSDWITKEPAICTFSSSEWFNVIAMIRDDGIYYYCNIASPIRWRKGVLTYIDYDVDVKIYPDWTYEVLDEDEFKSNRERLGYSLKIVSRVRDATKRLISMIQQRRGPFEEGYTEKWYSLYQS